MTSARPNALCLAVAVAISSSIIGTQALADRRLQTKSAVIPGNGYAEFIQSEVMLQPTLGLNEQPIAKSSTTTYPYEPRRSEGYDLPSTSFTEVLYSIHGGVSTVDQFETDEDNVAQKYTKVLKVGGEGVFRFTHNLEEKELLIEVRDGMTDQDSVEAIRYQVLCIQALEPFTKIASPEQLATVLEVASDRAGNLGTNDHYVALATIEVEKVEVNGRTFMRLIALDDQPPELQRLGQSLFVNDEALLAAATSAYMQVHVLEENLQQQALNDLLAHSKPVGYVVHVEDDTRVYPAPAGYPKLEVKEAPGEVIVFRGQKPNPDDIAFVENLYKLWVEAETNTPAPAATWVKKYRVKSYQYAIRSRQMALLEGFAARHDAGVNKDQPTTLTDEDKLAVLALSYYECLQLALSIATPAQAVEFEFTPEHVRAASSVITPTWLQIQLAKHFSFKPALKELLISQNFVKGIMNLIPVVVESQLDVFNHNEQFAAKVVSNMARQTVEWERQLQEHIATKSELIRVKNQLELISETATANEKKKHRALELKQQVEDDLVLIRKVLKKLEEQSQKLQYKVERIQYLQQHLHDAIKETGMVYNTQLAEMLGIDYWDDSQPPEEQARLIIKRIHEIKRSVAVTDAAIEQPLEEAVKTKMADIEKQLDITPNNENDLNARYQSILHYLQQQLQQQTERIDAVIHNRLAKIQHQLDLIPDIDKEPKVRSLTIQQYTKQKAAQVNQEGFLQPSQTINEQEDIKSSYTRARKSALAATSAPDSSELNQDITTEDLNALKSMVYNTLLKNAALEEELKDISIPCHSKAMPEVLETLRAAGKALGRKSHLREKDDVYFQRQVISEDMRLYIREARQQSEEEAWFTLQSLEAILKIEINEGDDKATRLERVLTRLDSGDVPNDELSKMENFVWWEADRPDLEKHLERDLKAGLVGVDIILFGIRDRLKFIVEESDQRARERQAHYLTAMEKALNIHPHVNPAAKEKGKIFIAKLAGDLQIGFADDANLSDQQHALRKKIRELMEEVIETYDDEGAKRIRNNQIAVQLKIKGYKSHAGIDEQNCLIEEKLEHLDVEVLKAGQPEVDERIAAIENELDRQMARLGHKPRFALDRDVAMARRAIKKAESELAGVYHRLKTLRGKNVVLALNRADLRHISDKEKTALNQGMKDVQIGLGLAAVDEQTPEERMRDIKHFLLECSAEKRDEVLEEIRTKSNLNIRTGDLGLKEESDYFIAIAAYANSDVQNQSDEALGEVILTWKKYTQIAQFLREHDRKSMEVTLARLEERNLQENLDRKKQEVIDFEDYDKQAKTVYENEMVRLNLALEQTSDAVSKAEVALTEFQNVALDATEEAVGLKPDANDTHEQRLNALRNKQLQLGGNDGFGGRIRKLIQEQVHLQDEIKSRKAYIERMKIVLKAAEEAIQSDGGPFQYTPKQAKVLNAIQKFTQQHPLKKQALDAAIGLTVVARESGKAIPLLTTFDFDDEFAPIRMRALAGNHLRFDQASRIVEIFKSLRTSSSESQPPRVLKEVQILSYRARQEIATGAQEYDDEILGMGKAGIHYVEYEPKDLKSFPEYFAARSASGNRIIALLREGLISKVELEHHMKAVRGVDGYQTVTEFEHFLGYKHGVKVPEFRKVVQMLSDEGTEEFMQSAFTPVTVTATGPAGMKESVAGMQEYATALIANYVLDDVAFDNGRRTLAFLTHAQDTLAPYAHAVGLSESDL
uniref:hypothetical protein n=2 Tax=unclassified Endozoicomonas TaxID=2644528 RepID=UPI0021474C60